jgi:hypothetical protein
MAPVTRFVSNPSSTFKPASSKLIHRELPVINSLEHVVNDRTQQADGRASSKSYRLEDHVK